MQIMSWFLYFTGAAVWCWLVVGVLVVAWARVFRPRLFEYVEWPEVLGGVVLWPMIFFA